jgi:hypothetical protein
MYKKGFEKFKNNSEHRVHLVEIVGAISLPEWATRTDYVLATLDVLRDDIGEPVDRFLVDGVLLDVTRYKIWDVLKLDKDTTKPILKPNTLRRDIIESCDDLEDAGMIERSIRGLALTESGMKHLGHLGVVKYELEMRVNAFLEPIHNGQAQRIIDSLTYKQVDHGSPGQE